MAKVYTAQEMREESNKVTRYDCYVASDMLRQAADAMEREARREKKYEYAVMADDGFVGRLHFSMTELIDDILNDGDKLIRREVGEWEEVKNEEL